MNVTELIECLMAPDRDYMNNIPQMEILKYPVVFAIDSRRPVLTDVLSVYVDHEKNRVIIDLD